MSSYQSMDYPLVRQASPVKPDRLALGAWKTSRKRSRVDDEDWDSLTVQRSPGFKYLKLRESREIIRRDKSPVSKCVTTSSAERPPLPLADITHQSRVPKCIMGQQNVLAIRRREKATRNLFSTATRSSDVVAIESEKSSSVGARPVDETVTYVNDLFSPVAKLQAIPLTLEELQRRTEYPECFGRAEMVSYLRHSKTTGNEILAKYNLKPKSNRPRLNVLSRLCEREAKTLANGIHKMNTEYFPMSYVADAMKEQMEQEKDRALLNGNLERNNDEGRYSAADDNKETIASTIDLLQNLKKFLKDPDEDLAKDLEIFERATHTFGCQNIMNHIGFVESYLEELQKKL